MIVYLEDIPIEVPDNMGIDAFLAAYSEYGEEAVMYQLNGTIYRSIDDHDFLLHDGDKIRIYPLIVGG